MNKLLTLFITAIAAVSLTVLLLERSRPGDQRIPSEIVICNTVGDGAYLYAYDRIMHRMHQDMESVAVVSDDRLNFLRQMIPHHRGAIEMAEAIVQATDDRRVLNLARGMIADQRNEIAIMESLIHQLKNDSTSIILP